MPGLRNGRKYCAGRTDALEVIAPLLSEDDFSSHHNKLIFRQILSLMKSSQCADLTAVAEALERSNELNKVGGLSYLQSLTVTLTAKHIRRCGL